MMYWCVTGVIEKLIIFYVYKNYLILINKKELFSRNYQFNDTKSLFYILSRFRYDFYGVDDEFKILFWTLLKKKTY